MEEKLKLLDEQSRYELQVMYDRLTKFANAIGIEYEEFHAIKTALYYLDNAINYEEKFLS